MKRILLSTLTLCLAMVANVADAQQQNQQKVDFGGFQMPKIQLETSQEWKDVNYAGDDQAYHTCDIYLPKKEQACVVSADPLEELNLLPGRLDSSRFWRGSDASLVDKWSI